MLKRLTVLVLIAAGLPVVARAAVPSYDETVQQRILPQEEQLLLTLVKDKRDSKLDGVAIFNGDDKFLPGKIAMGLTDYLLSLPKGDPRLPAYIQDFRQVAAMTADDANDSWGAYYYLYALDRLRQVGLLSQAVDRLTLAKLRVKLDFRMFVDADNYDLIDHPNNYYVVAFAIARLREQMGWETGKPSEILYAKVAEHYRLYSGAYGFADETDGDGRFDRYSVLLAGELANHFLETGQTPPDEVKAWLRKSADVMLLRIQADGSGFEYGRSLGPYGETAIIEVLTAAARSGVLTDAEKQLAYDYAARAAQRYVEFWIDPRTGSVNLWDNGRRTDAYRGKFRILGENLSLAHQYAYTSAGWNLLGFKDRAPPEDWARAIDTLPKQATTWFARGTYDRLLVTVRDGGHVFGLPLINGASGQHNHNPYFPIPYARGLIEGVADGEAPLLVPQFTLRDGSKLMPLAFFRDAQVKTEGVKTTVTYRQSEVDRLGQSNALADDRLAVATTYVFEPGRITRTDVYTPRAPLELATIRLDFGSFSSAATARGNTMTFGQGAVTSFAAEGLQCQVQPTNGDRDYQSDTGAMASVVHCIKGAGLVSAPFTLGWTVEYR
ncbi:MAG: hypothetical protein JWM33_3185 [Caulobacteraceae bacterium]|nr:hypothetical protein [Caulobacteraceae bacterium]